MDDLSGNFLLIVLNIAEGRGFDFLQNSLFIEATLKRSKIETEAFLAEPNPSIYTELVWETEKKEIRKLRSCHIPVRIECYTFNDKNERERIGFVLINLRNVRAISSKTNLEEKPKWYKLLGTPKEYKKFCPELALTLIIKDQIEDDISTTNANIMEACVTKDIELNSTRSIPLVYLEGGTIQIGNETSTYSNFLLHIIINESSNLDLLLPEEMVFNETTDKFQFSINFFGVQVNSNRFCKNLHREITLNQKWSVKLYTDIKTLTSYFQETADFRINFCCGQTILGYAYIDLKDFLLDEFMRDNFTYQKEQMCELSYEEETTTLVAGNSRRPFVRISVMLEQNTRDETIPKPNSSEMIETKNVSSESKSSEVIETKNLKFCSKSIETKNLKTCSESIETKNLKTCSEPIETKNLKTCSESIDTKNLKTCSESIDTKNLKTCSESIDTKDLKTCSEPIETKNLRYSSGGSGDKIKNTVRKECIEVEKVGAPERTPRSVLSVFNNNVQVKKNVGVQSDLLEEDIKADNFDGYHLYCLVIIVKSITWRKHFKQDEFLFKFKHPKANNILTIHCDINCNGFNEVTYLDDVFCTLHFISNATNIFSLYTLYSPLLSIFSPANKFKTEEIHIYTQLLSPQCNTSNYLAILSNSTDKNDLLCDLDINIKYIDLGTNLKTKQKHTDFDLDPYILDDWLVVKNIDDWQEWRKYHEEEFKRNMKMIEKKTLEKLEYEWSLHRTELEMKLKEGIEKCSVLSEELKFATTELKLKKMQLEDHSIYNLSTIESIEMRVTQMLEEEKKKDMEKLVHEKESLKERIMQLQEEKNNLKKSFEDKCKELEDLNQTTLTKEQTTCLLQEVRSLEQKYCEALEEKAFFKEQWGKAAKEVHMLKEEKQEQFRLDIHKKKEELSQLSLASSDTLCDTPRDDGQSYEVLSFVEYLPGQFYSNAF